MMFAPRIAGSDKRRGARVAIVGGGVGGLAASIRLAAAGAQVVILERAERPGGKLRQVDVGGRWVDAGPTVLEKLEVSPNDANFKIRSLVGSESNLSDFSIDAMRVMIYLRITI